MTHYMFQSNTFTTAVQNHECYLMHLRIKTNVPKQSNKVHPVHSYSQSVVNQQPQHQVPPCLQCHDVSYFSLSLSTPVPKLPGQPNSLKLQFQGHQCKRPSSPTVPAHYRTSGVPLLTSYLNTTFTSYSCENPILPRSLPKHSLTLQVPTFLYPSPSMTPISVAPRTVHSVRPGSTTT